MSSDPLHVREAHLDDAPYVARLIELLGYPCSAKQMRTRLEHILPSADHVTFVALRSGRIVGMAGAFVSLIYEEDGLVGRLLALSVDAEEQGQGIGAALVERAEQWMAQRGATMFMVNSGLQRGDAHRFYEHLGYTKKGFSFRKMVAGG